MIIYRKNYTACIGAAFSILALFMIFMNSRYTTQTKIQYYQFPEYQIRASEGSVPKVQYYTFPETVITSKR